MVKCPQCGEMDDPGGPGDPCFNCGHGWTAEELIRIGGFDPENMSQP